MNTQKATKQREKGDEASTFLSMVHLFKCAEFQKDYLCTRKKVTGKSKETISLIFKRLDVYIRDETHPLPQSARDLWKCEIKRDYQVFSSVFEKMAQMTDEQRNAVEQAAEGILNNELQPIDNTKNND